MRPGRLNTENNFLSPEVFFCAWIKCKGWRWGQGGRELGGAAPLPTEGLRSDVTIKVRLQLVDYVLG